MCKPALGCLALGLAAVLAAPGPAPAQQTEEELVQRLDSLVPLLPGARQRAAAAQAAARRARDTHMKMDTVAVGLLTLLVVPGEEDVARDVVGGVWARDYASWVDASPSLAAGRIFFQWSARPVEFRSSSFRVHTVQGSRWKSRSYMEAGVREVISVSLRGDLSNTPFYRDWSITGVAPPKDPAAIYRQVVLAASYAARSCLAGDAASCISAFGLSPADSLLSEQYSPAERRVLLQQNATRFGLTGSAAMRACSSGDAAACDRILEGVNARYSSAMNRLWAVPFGPEVRSSLLWYALRTGGPGAWSRLLAHTDGEPIATLEAAAGVDRNELVRGWRSWLLEHRPVRQAGLGTQALAGAAWVLLLIALAARSTRWRFE